MELPSCLQLIILVVLVYFLYLEKREGMTDVEKKERDKKVDNLVKSNGKFPSFNKWQKNIPHSDAAEFVEYRSQY
jgi:hypothetical protein